MPIPDIYPVFVSVLKARQPSPEQLQVEISGLTAVVARTCSRPEQNVHILYRMTPESSWSSAFRARGSGGAPSVSRRS